MQYIYSDTSSSSSICSPKLNSSLRKSIEVSSKQMQENLDVWTGMHLFARIIDVPIFNTLHSQRKLKLNLSLRKCIEVSSLKMQTGILIYSRIQVLARLIYVQKRVCAVVHGLCNNLELGKTMLKYFSKQPIDH